MLYDKDFHNKVKYAILKQKEYDNVMEDILLFLESISPLENKWYMLGKGFVQVDVASEDIDDYLCFFDDLMGCKYTYCENLNGITLILSISTLDSVLDDMIV